MYKVNHTRRKVYAKPLALSEKEKEEVKAYLDLAYTISEPKEQPKQTEEEKAKNKFSMVNVQKYLEENGTKEQQKHYWKLFNAPAIDKKTRLEKTYKLDTKDGKHKAGDIKVRGHIATLRWFKTTFPNY